MKSRFLQLVAALALAVGGFLMLAAEAPATAAPLTGLQTLDFDKAAPDQGLVQKVHGRRHHRWRRFRRCRWHWSRWRGWHRHCRRRPFFLRHHFHKHGHFHRNRGCFISSWGEFVCRF